MLTTLASSLPQFHDQLQHANAKQPMTIMIMFGSSISMPREVWRVSLHDILFNQAGAVTYGPPDVRYVMRTLFDAYTEMTLEDLGMSHLRYR